MWGTPFDDSISAAEARQLIAQAEKQTVAGLLIDTLIKKNVRMDQQTVFEAYVRLEQIKRQNQTINAAVTRFARLMDDEKIDYVVVKGQTLAALYPEPLTRMSGDIDFLVNDYQRTAEVLRTQWGVDLPKRLLWKEFAFTYGNALYELHTFLVDFGSRKHHRYWEQALAASTPASVQIGGERVSVMEPTLYAAYVFFHLFYHFMIVGIGLRHLCDWAVMMHHYRDEIDAERLATLLQNVGLLKAFRAFGTILVDDLGLPTFPLPIEDTDRKWKTHILSSILKGGNWGRSKRVVQKDGIKHKIESAIYTLGNTFRYMPLAPREVSLVIYRRTIVNFKLALQKQK
ncbi:MAG: nucleotidyltransferase family protein [Prevotellaceae bacterium]|nr:nucleotidyltransferase family protein [Prevotellaceae bacterium]